jgi:hypothetical protein
MKKNLFLLLCTAFATHVIACMELMELIEKPKVIKYKLDFTTSDRNNIISARRIGIHANDTETELRETYRNTEETNAAFISDELRDAIKYVADKSEYTELIVTHNKTHKIVGHTFRELTHLNEREDMHQRLIAHCFKHFSILPQKKKIAYTKQWYFGLASIVLGAAAFYVIWKYAPYRSYVAND